MGFKVFDSHSRDLYGWSNTLVTCVLPELSSLNSWIHNFQSIHKNDIFEIKGVKLRTSLHVCTNSNLNCTVTVATVPVYSICYSMMKSLHLAKFGGWRFLSGDNMHNHSNIKKLCRTVSQYILQSISILLYKLFIIFTN